MGSKLGPFLNRLKIHILKKKNIKYTMISLINNNAVYFKHVGRLDGDALVNKCLL